MNDIVLNRVRSWMSSVKLGAGDRLPPERDLSQRLGISRTNLRKALLVLEVEGRLHRRVGKGTFLTKTQRSSADRSGMTDIGAFVDTLAERTGPHEAMTARLALEPELSGMAALHATPRHLSELRRLSETMRTVSSWAAYEENDAAFHDLIADASGNSLLHDLHQIVNGVRMVVVWSRLSTPNGAPPKDYHSFAEHDAIVAALESREVGAARAAMKAHLRSTLATMTADG